MTRPVLSAIAFGFLLLNGCSETERAADGLQVGELVGELYYIAEGSCGFLGDVIDTGHLLTDVFSRGPCGPDSRFECRSDRCLLACMDYAGSDTTALWEVQRASPDEEWTGGEVFLLAPPVPQLREDESFGEYNQIYRRPRFPSSTLGRTAS